MARLKYALILPKNNVGASDAKLIVKLTNFFLSLFVVEILKKIKHQLSVHYTALGYIKDVLEFRKLNFRNFPHKCENQSRILDMHKLYTK